MADETDTSDGTVTVETEVTVPDPVPDPVPDAPDVTTVVVNTPDDTPSDTVPLLDHERRLTDLESRLAAVEEIAADARFRADVASETADAAIDAAMTPEPEPEPEPDREPVQKHWLHKSWGELLGRQQS